MNFERQFENQQPESGNEKVPDIEKLMEYEPKTERGWQEQHRSAEEVGTAVGDFSRQFEDLSASLDGKVQAGNITPEQRGRILEQMSGVLNSHLSASERGVSMDTSALQEQGGKMTLERVKEAGKLLGKATSAILEAPGKAVDKFFAGILRSGRKSLGELTRMGTEPLKEISSSIKESAGDLSKAGAEVAKRGIDTVTEAIRKPGKAVIDTAGHAISETLTKTGEGLSNMTKHVSEGVGESYRVLVNKASQGTAEAIGRVPTALGRGVVLGATGGG